MNRLLLPVCSLLLCWVAPARAQDQQPGEVRERVALMRDTAALRRLEDGHRREKHVEDQLTAGFAALQLWYLTEERRHLGRARDYFDRAAELDAGAAWAHYGHALTFIPEIDDETGRLAVDNALGRAIGMDPVSRARRALERAVAIDPTLPDAAELLGRFAALTRDPGAMKLARAVLEEATAPADAPSALLLGLARTAREQGDYAAAAHAAERVTGRGDVAFAAAHLELAAALASTPRGREDAGYAYELAVANAADSLLARIWGDIELIADEVEQARWAAATSVAEQRAALRAFWDRRAALAGTSWRERVGEHYRRLNFATQHFRRWGMYGAAPLNALRWGRVDPTYSDQGIIYIRHGHPNRIYELPLSPYSAWFYSGEQGEPRSFHFMRFEGEAGWSRDAVLVRRLPCLDPDVALHDPRLRPLAYGCNAMRIESVSATLRRDAEQALRTVTDAPSYARPIPFQFDLYSFRGAADGTDVALAVGVPLARIPRSDPSLLLRFAVVDTADDYTATAETRLPPVVRSQAADALLRAQLQLLSTPTPAAAYRVTVRDERGDAGTTYGGTIEVPDYSGSALMLSDVVLAEPATEGSFTRAGHRLSLAPTQSFPGGRFRAYYEIYNLPAGRAYGTELSIERTDRSLAARVFGGGEPVRLRFDDLAPDDGSTVVALREVEAPVEPGNYRLTVRVTAADGTEYTRERRFTIPEK